MSQGKEAIFNLIKKSSKPLIFEEIVRLLNVHKKEIKSIKRLLKEMTLRGEIVKTRKGHYGLPDEMNLITGYFEAHRDGYGFVIPEKPGERDLFIPARLTAGAMDNDRVIARIEEPANRSGRIIKILKKPDTPKAEVESIIEELNIPQKFPENIKLEAKKLAKKDFTRHDRKDLTNQITITIDEENAKDFDDAISIKKTTDGYILYVHIADVGYYVPWDSPIDKEARKRGTSVYFPDRVIPMLPEVLSEDLCSLKPLVERPTFTAEMFFNEKGERLQTSFYPSFIKSSQRMTYTSVKRILIDKEPSERARYHHLLPHIETMEALAKLLRENRLKMGSLDFDLPEPEVILDLQGRPENIIKAERTFANIIIEEFMIAANEAVAEYLEELGVPTIFRVHEKPDPMKGTPEEEIVNYILLRSLKQARYSPRNVGHFGLASKCYTHFASPIRRYPDLVIHRILRDVLTNRLSDKKAKDLEEILPGITFHSSRMERLADEAEKTVVDAMRVWFMEEKVYD